LSVCMCPHDEDEAGVLPGIIECSRHVLV